MKDEGYIKFNCVWIEKELPGQDLITELNYWRQKLYDQQLIGADDKGIGYGNISCRMADNKFLITGTTTGNIRQLTHKHYTIVTNCDIPDNTLTCEGPVKASSESLTHAIIYSCLPDVKAVVHIHNMAMWHKLINNAPTTSQKAAYGTPEMANEIKQLIKSTGFKESNMLVMAGHDNGLLAYGKDLKEAAIRFFPVS